MPDREAASAVPDVERGGTRTIETDRHSGSTQALCQIVSQALIARFSLPHELARSRSGTALVYCHCACLSRSCVFHCYQVRGKCCTVLRCVAVYNNCYALFIATGSMFIAPPATTPLLFHPLVLFPLSLSCSFPCALGSCERAKASFECIQGSSECV